MLSLCGALTASSPPESTSSSSSWEGWQPSDTYYQPLDPSSTSSSRTGGACRPHTSSTSHWPNSSSTPVTTLVTTRPVTITTFTTEAWSTMSGEATSSSSTETGGADYPAPTRTRCPHAEDMFTCGGDGDDEQPRVVAVEMREEDKDEHSVTGGDEPRETQVPVSAAGAMGETVLGSLWLVVGMIVAMI